SPEYSSMIAAARPHLPQIGKPEAALSVKDDVVRPAKLVFTTTVVEARYFSCSKVNPLDAARLVVSGSTVRSEQAIPLDPSKAAIVAAEQSALRPKSQSVWSPTRRRHHRLLSLRGYASNPASGD